MGAGGQYPYPKEVWSPAGGWWSRPKNWKMNTFITAIGITGITYYSWMWSAKKEFRHLSPRKPIPSQWWSPQAKSLGVREE